MGNTCSTCDCDGKGDAKPNEFTINVHLNFLTLFRGLLLHKIALTSTTAVPINNTMKIMMTISKLTIKLRIHL